MTMNRVTGKPIGGLDLIRQAAVDVLGTVRGERVMRLDYGSRLLESIDDPVNSVGHAVLLGRVADPLIRWEGDRLELKRVDVEMPEPGKVNVLIEGATDLGTLSTIETIEKDSRYEASEIFCVSYFLGDTTIALAMDNLRQLMAKAVYVASVVPPVANFVQPETDPPNCASIAYGGYAHLQAGLDDLYRAAFRSATTGAPMPSTPAVPSYPAAYDPPNAIALDFDGTLANQVLGAGGGFGASVNNAQAAVWRLELFVDVLMVTYG